MKTKFLLLAFLLVTAFANQAVAQSAGEYKSNGTGGGNWNNAASWLVYNGTEYTPAQEAPSANALKVVVQASDAITIASDEIINKLIVDSGALVTIASAQTVTLNSSINVNGAFEVNGGLVCNSFVVTGNGLFNLKAGATLNIGSLAGIDSLGATGSVQTAIRRFNGAANYIYTSTFAQVTGSGLPTVLTGSITDNNVNAASGLTLSRSTVINGAGSFIVPASRILSFKGATTLSGSGNFILNSGASFLIGHTAGISSLPGTGCLQVSGNKILSADANYIYNGTTGQVLGNALPSPLTGTLTIRNTTAGGCGLSNNFIVNAPGRISVTGVLSCATYIISGTGTFTLNANATLLTANPSGISNTGTSGSIQTSVFTFNAAANYGYNGTAAQITGLGLPASITTLTISNTAGVKLANQVTITGSLVLGAGTLCLNGFNLTMASDKTIIRQAGSLSLCSGKLVFPGLVNLTYSGTNNITPGAEMPADPSKLNNLTIALSAGKIFTLGNTTTVNGSLNITSGILALGGKELVYGPSAALVYNGTVAQTVGEEWPDNSCNVAINIRNTNATTGVILNANKTAYTGTLAIKSGGFFNSGNFIVSGSGNFNVNAGGTFITRHAAGVSPSGAVQLTGTRIFAAGSSYTFNGSVIQATGPEMPASVANLTIDNKAANPEVILTNAGTGIQTISGTLALLSGIFNVGANNMSLAFHTANMPISRAAGSINISPATSLQFGVGSNSGGNAFELPKNLFTQTTPVLNDLVINRKNSITLSNQNLIINGTLQLTAGVLDLGNTTLIFQKSDLPVKGGLGSVLFREQSSLQFGTAEHMEGKPFTLPDNFFAVTPVFANLTINRTNSLVLGAQDMTLTGSLNLLNGVLHIGASTLTLNGNINSTKGLLEGGETSGIVIGGTGSQVVLPVIKNKLRTLTIARPNSASLAAVKLGADLHIESAVDLSNGSLALAAANLLLGSAAAILNADSNHYIVTADNAVAGGYLVQNVPNGIVAFPVGTTHFTPAFLINAGNTVDTFKVRVFDGVLSRGTSGTDTNSKHVVNKTWAIEKVGAGPSETHVKLQWNAADEAATFDRTNCFIARFDSSGWDKPTASQAIKLKNGQFSQLRTGISGSALYSIQEDASLPIVTWLSFTAYRLDEQLLLNWSVFSKKGAQDFDIERSVNGRVFYKIGNVKGLNTTSGSLNYSFVDSTPVNFQTSYYRIKQIGLDSGFLYSRILKIAADPVFNSIAYPMPVHNQVNIALYVKYSTAATVYITDAGGKLVKLESVHLRKGNNIIPVSTQQLPRGIYVLQVVVERTVIANHKIVK